MPGEFERGEAELEGAHGEFIAARGERVPQDVLFVLTEVFDDGLFGVFEGLGVDIVIPFLEHDDLAKDAEAGMHAALSNEVL